MSILCSCGHYRRGGWECLLCIFSFSSWGLSRTTQETTGSCWISKLKVQACSLAVTLFGTPVQEDLRLLKTQTSERLRLTWSLSSDKAEFERAGRNLIPDERAPKPDVLALRNLKGTKSSWSYRQEPRQGWGRGEQRLSGCGLKPLTWITSRGFGGSEMQEQFCQVVLAPGP